MSSSEETLILEPSERKRIILELIASARRRLVLSVFRCQDFAVLDEIAAAVNRNVRVSALLTPSAKNWDKRLKDLEKLLESMGAEVLRYAGPHAKYHAKYIVVDEQRALVASLNFTPKCFERTCDFLLISNQPELVTSLSRLFAADSGRPPAPLPEGLSTRVLLGPDNARERFSEIIASARSSIRIIDHRVRDSAIVRLLQEREHAGVVVQILGQGDLGDLTSHGKLLLVDDQVAVIGSASLARPSLNDRREISLRIDDDALVERLSRYFERLASTAGFVESAPVVADDSADDDDVDL